MTEIINNHKHTGLDSPKVKEDDLLDAVNKETVVLLTTAQTIADVKTFTSIPVLPASDPTTDNQAVRKSYVDDMLSPTYTIDTSLNIADSADTERTSTVTAMTKKKEIEFNDIDGIITVYFELKDNGGLPVSAQVYKNGSPAGTSRDSTGTTYISFSENFSVVTDDLIQLYVDANGVGRTAYIQNFRLKYARYITPTSGTVNQD